MLESMGFAADTLDSVCITFDKMDKIGADGVKAELLEKQLPESAVNALADFIAAGEVTLDAVAARCADPAIADDLKYVLATANAMAAGRYQVAYCPSLVRGSGLRTPVMVFEIHLPAVQRRSRGGGRYDNMVGKFLGTQCRQSASPSASSASAASCSSRVIRFPAQSRRSHCSTARTPTSPPS